MDLSTSRPNRFLFAFRGDGTGLYPSVTTFVLVFVLLSFIPALSWAQSVDQAELKRAFFQDLSEDQIVKLLETIDASDQLTSVELGAKYKWGYIPPDRTPPFSLARWWDNQNARQKRQVRIQWFRNHFQELNVERAARELEMREKLTTLYRELSQDDGPGDLSFEKVSFPKDNLDIDTAEETVLPESYRRFGADPESVGRDESPSPAPDDGEPSPSKPAEDREAPESADPEPTTPPSSTPAEETTEDTTPEEEEKPDWKKTLRFEGGAVIYERVGDRIRVIRRKDKTYDHLEREPEHEFPFRDESPSDQEDIEPPLRFDGENPSPELRFYERESGSAPPAPAPR